MIESMLEPHLKRNAGASQGDVGLTFFILGGVYMISSPIVGLVSFINLQIFLDQQDEMYKINCKMYIQKNLAD
jgi:hypothetical protein